MINPVKITTGASTIVADAAAHIGAAADNVASSGVKWGAGPTALADRVPMQEVSEGILHAGHRKAVGFQKPSTIEEFALGLNSARNDFRTLVATGKDGADAATLSQGFAALRDKLEGVANVGVLGPVRGHVDAARTAARDLSAALGTSSMKAGDNLPEPIYAKAWDIRQGLDMAWEQLGTQKLLGGLRRYE